MIFLAVNFFTRHHGLTPILTGMACALVSHFLFKVLCLFNDDLSTESIGVLAIIAAILYVAAIGLIAGALIGLAFSL